MQIANETFTKNCIMIRLLRQKGYKTSKQENQKKLLYEARFLAKKQDWNEI